MEEQPGLERTVLAPPGLWGPWDQDAPLGGGLG